MLALATDELVTGVHSKFSILRHVIG